MKIIVLLACVPQINLTELKPAPNFSKLAFDAAMTSAAQQRAPSIRPKCLDGWTVPDSCLRRSLGPVGR